MGEILKAPWTREQIANLETRQQREDMHEYACPKCGKSLIPTPGGWACDGLVSQDRTCDYEQDWCHKLDAI
jgi:hypothetical protein